MPGIFGPAAVYNESTGGGGGGGGLVVRFPRHRASSRFQPGCRRRYPAPAASEHTPTLPDIQLPKNAVAVGKGHAAVAATCPVHVLNMNSSDMSQ